MKIKSIAKVKKLERRIKQLAKDMERIMLKHDSFRSEFSSLNSLEKWFESLPIETIKELYCFEKNMPRAKLSLNDLEEKSRLRKEFLKKSIELEITEHKYKELLCSNLLKDIEKIQEKLNE